MLQANGVCVDVPARRLLHDIDLSLAAGELLVLLGPNGAGKSTLLRALAGEVRPAAGRITLNGQGVHEQAPATLARHRAVLSQGSAVFGDFTCAEIVELGRSAFAEPARMTADLAADAMALTGVSALARQPFRTCSGGEQQRVQLARVLAQLMPLSGGAPACLLLDEPTAALDPAFQVSMLELVADLRSAGLAIMAVLHDLNVAAQFADRIVLLKDGRIRAEGSPAATLEPTTLESVYDTRFHCLQHESLPHPVVIAAARPGQWPAARRPGLHTLEENQP